MKPLYIKLLFMLCIFSFINTQVYAQIPNPEAVQAIAIYEATVDTNDDWPDSQVNYNITDPVLISNMFSGIESDTMRDCSTLEADNNAYIYVRFNDGTRKVYHLFFRWTHISVKGGRGQCYYVTPSSKALFMSHTQQ